MVDGWLVELVNACLVNGWLVNGWLVVWLTDCLADLKLQSIMVKCTAAISTGIVNAYLLLQPRLNPERHPQSLDK